MHLLLDTRAVVRIAQHGLGEETSRLEYECHDKIFETESARCTSVLGRAEIRSRQKLTVLQSRIACDKSYIITGTSYCSLSCKRSDIRLLSGSNGTARGEHTVRRTKGL